MTALDSPVYSIQLPGWGVVERARSNLRARPRVYTRPPGTYTEYIYVLDRWAHEEAPLGDCRHDVSSLR